MSSSVAGTCERDSQASDLCASEHAILSKFSRERRDSAWADLVEGELRDYLRSVGGGKFTIRSLQCRTTVCAAEVTSSERMPLILTNRRLREKLRSGYGAYGYETDSAGARITVSLALYERR